jgi:hypothetical protein
MAPPLSILEAASMKTILALAILSSGLAAPAAVDAGELRLGAQLLFSPDGTHTYDVPGDDVLTESLARSYGVAALLGYDVSRYLSVGLVPGALFGVGFDRESNPETFTGLELSARVTGRIPLGGGGIELQIHGAPGYSWMLESSDWLSTPRGWALGLGVGLAVPVSPHVSIVGEVGKTYGSHRTMARGYYVPNQPPSVRDIGYSFDTVRIGLGVQVTL